VRLGLRRPTDPKYLRFGPVGHSCTEGLPYRDSDGLASIDRRIPSRIGVVPVAVVGSWFDLHGETPAVAVDDRDDVLPTWVTASHHAGTCGALGYDAVRGPVPPELGFHDELPQALYRIENEGQVLPGDVFVPDGDTVAMNPN